MISIVIPYFSGLNDLKNCLSSIKKQRVNCEIIVVNDSEEALELEMVKIIDNKKNVGAAYSRNIGFKKAKFNLVLFVDHDILLEKNCIKYLTEQIKKVDIVFPKVVYENGMLMHPLGMEKVFPQISACFMIKKKSVEKMDELFDENYRTYLEDADFFLRVNLFGLKLKYVAEAVAIHKLKNGFNEKRFYLENRNLLYGWIKFLGINKKDILHPFHLSSWFSNFICAIFNFDKFDYSHYNRNISLLKKTILLFRKHKKITNKNKLILWCYMFKAQLWVIFHIGFIFKKRNQLLNLLNSQK